MNVSRRGFVQIAAGAIACPALPSTALKGYPSRPIRLLVSSPPGGTADFLARIMSPTLSKRLGQAVVIENKGGAGNTIAAETVAAAPADGHSLLVVNPAHLLHASLHERSNFNFVRDISPVASILRAPNVMEVHPSVPAKDVPEFIAYAKANPGKLSYGSAGAGTLLHLGGELFNMMASVDIVHVPYRGTAPALTDLLGGQIHMMCDNISTSIEHIRAGRLRPLAVTTAKRSELLTELPTVGDFLPGFEQSALFGVGAPKNTPAEIVSHLNDEINAALADPVINAQLRETAGTVLPGSPADFNELITSEIEKWNGVIKTLRIEIR
jgi:tripartite-type tricarboxylate transporter receptor subunit TctC